MHAHSTILFDDLGRQRPVEHQRPGRRGPGDGDVLDIRVRERGYVAVTDGPESLNIRLHPLIVSGTTVAALLYFIAERRPRRTTIRWFGEKWHRESCEGTRPVIDSIGRILENSLQRPAPQAFLATRRNLQAAFQKSHPFERVLGGWLNKHSDRRLPNLLRECGLQDRAMIADQDANGRFRFRHVGKAIRIFEPDWIEVAAGKRVCDQPDAAYGAWIEDGCHAVTRSQSLRYEFVNAVVKGRAGESRHWRYERLVLPWITAKDRKGVISVSLPDHGPGR